MFNRHSNGSTEYGEDQPDEVRSLSRSASENSVALAQHERNNNNNSTNNESINGYAHRPTYENQSKTEMINLLFCVLIALDRRRVQKVVLVHRTHHCTVRVKKTPMNRY